MRRGHLKHKGYCTCGVVVAGNGGKASHRKMHQRKGDGHHYIVWHDWERRKAKADAAGMSADDIARVGL
jgi:hypothetical protein